MRSEENRFHVIGVQKNASFSWKLKLLDKRFPVITLKGATRTYCCCLLDKRQWAKMNSTIKKVLRVLYLRHAEMPKICCDPHPSSSSSSAILNSKTETRTLTIHEICNFYCCGCHCLWFLPEVPHSRVLFVLRCWVLVVAWLNALKFQVSEMIFFLNSFW